MKRFSFDIVCCLAIIILGLAIALPRFCNGIDLGDEGFLAYGAVRVMEGQIPNRDFFSLQPPLSFYTMATVFKLFGTSLTTLRTLGLCIYLLIPLLIYALSQQVTRPMIALAVAVPALVLGMPFFDFVPLAVWHGVLTTLVAAFLFAQAVNTSRRSWGFTAGVATALTILLRHDQGFYLLVALCTYAFIHKLTNSGGVDKSSLWRILSFWSLGIMTLMLPIGIYWSVCGIIPDIFNQLIVFPLTVYPKTSVLPMPRFNFDQPPTVNIVVALFYLPPTIQGLTVVLLLIRVLRRRFTLKDTYITFILFFSMLFYCQVLVRSDLEHLLITLPPLFVLCAWWFETTSKEVGIAIKKISGLDTDGRLVSFASASVILLLTSAVSALFLFYTKPLFLRSLQEPTRRIDLDRAGVRVEAQMASKLEPLIAMIQKNVAPDRSILCLPYQPMLYFLSGRRNPTHWNYLWPGDQTPQDHQNLIDQAKRDPPGMVIIFNRQNVQRYAPTIIDYVDSKYACAGTSGILTVYFPSNREKNGVPEGSGS